MYAILRMAPYDYCTHLLLQVHVGVIVLKFRCRILTHAKPHAKALLRFLNLKRRIGLVNNMAEAESFGPRATEISKRDMIYRKMVPSKNCMIVLVPNN